MIIEHPQFNPVALSLGPLEIHWYGLMYLIAFAIAWFLGRRRLQQGYLDISQKRFEDLLFYGIVGVILGGRLGYVLFYQPGFYLQNPLAALAIWDGGMSFHGGLIGVLVAMLIFARRENKSFFEIGDFVAPLIPLGLAVGRWGNFMNGELWGRPTNGDWGMIFPMVDHLPRHPSQLYQIALEGILLFVIVWFYSKKLRPTGCVSAVFLMGYGIFRFIAEFGREPDAHLGLVALDLSMGQWLSLPMIVLGIVLFVVSAKKSRPTP